MHGLGLPGSAGLAMGDPVPDVQLPFPASQLQPFVHRAGSDRR